MGLDMYARSTAASAVGDQQIDVKVPDDTPSAELAYWRKFNQLHGWMEDLYRQKGGQEEFNCVAVRLMPEDLTALSAWLLLEDKPSRPGFFFGSGEIYLEDIETAQAFVVKAQEEIAEGQAVMYSSWW